jgi:hypothetical protein
VGPGHDPVLARAAALAAARGAEAHVVDNTLAWGVSVPVQDDRVVQKLAAAGRTITADEIESLLLLSFHAASPPGLADDDRSYAEQESVAAWLAFVALLPSRVVNRPRSARFPLVHAAPVQQRVFARELGIPTAPETLCDGSELARLRRRGIDAACVDLATQRSFWLQDDGPRAPGRLYSVVRIFREAGYGIAARAGERCMAFRYAPGTAATVCREEGMTAPASAMFDALGLEYGYCVFARAEGGLAFTQLSTLTPAALRPGAVRLLAQELQRMTVA